MRVTILIPAPAAPLSLLAQDPGPWRALLIGPDVPPVGFESRIQALPARGNTAALLNAGLDHIDRSADDWLLLLGPGDELLPCALSKLILAAQRNPQAAAIAGAFCFTSPIGDLPAAPAPFRTGTTASPTLTLEDLFTLRPPASSVLINTRALGDLRLRTDPTTHTGGGGLGAELDLLFRLAQTGGPILRESTPIIRRPLAPLADLDHTLRDLASHIRILADAAIDLSTAPDSPAADLIDAAIVLRAHQRALAERGPDHLQSLTRFPFLYAQWWHRCGLLGPAPRHVLDANGGIAQAVASDPALIARRILSMCPRNRTPILLGLGRNARTLAHALHSAGLKVVGRDDAAASPPEWSTHDQIPVEVLPREAPFDPAATHIMTVLHDEAFMARLPQGLRIIRWSEMPGLILAEWRAAALDWALRVELAETGVPGGLAPAHELKPVPIGAPA